MTNWNQKIEWCSFHNLPMSRCNHTSSMSCTSLMIPIGMAYDIAHDKDYITKRDRNIDRGLVKEIQQQDEELQEVKQ